MKLTVFTDGGARGNPGPAAAGAVIFCRQGIVAQAGAYLGRKTNNEAEYLAVKLALGILLANWQGLVTAVDFYLDSQLVVSQLEGRFKIKAANLKILAAEIKKELRQFGVKTSFYHCPREKNKIADGLVNKVLDCLGKGVK